MTPEQLAKAVFDEAVRCQATAAEFFLRHETRIQASVQGCKPQSYVHRTLAAAGVRVFHGNRWGLSHGTDLSAGALRRLARDASALAQASPEDPHAILAERLAPGPPAPPTDPALAALTRDDRFAMALAIERGAFETDPRVRSSRYVSFTDGRAETFLANTRGFRAARETAGARLSAMFGAREGVEGQQLFGGAASRRLGTLDPGGLGASVARRLAVTLGGRPLPTGSMDVVIDASQSPVLLGALGSAFDGDAVRRGRSFLAGRVGTAVASPRIRVMDDPLDDAAFGALPWDDEGVRSPRPVLVDEGVLRGYLYDLSSASAAGAASTGNGVRAAADVPPSVAPHNLLLAPGPESLEALLGGVEEGLYVTGFMGRAADPVTGEVSAAALGARIVGGRIAQPVAGVTLSGTLEGFLRAVDGVGDRLEGEDVLRSPALRIRGIRVAGPDRGRASGTRAFRT